MKSAYYKGKPSMDRHTRWGLRRTPSYRLPKPRFTGRTGTPRCADPQGWRCIASLPSRKECLPVLPSVLETRPQMSPGRDTGPTTPFIGLSRGKLKNPSSSPVSCSLESRHFRDLATFPSVRQGPIQSRYGRALM